MSNIARRESIATLLREAGGAHHHAFAHTNGEDPDWPRWYAEYLATPLGRLLDKPLAPAALAADLVTVDAEHRAAPGRPDWPLYYADWFLSRYGDAASV